MSVYHFSNDLLFHVNWAGILIFFFIATQIVTLSMPCSYYYVLAFHHSVTYYIYYNNINYINIVCTILPDDYAHYVYKMCFTYII